MNTTAAVGGVDPFARYAAMNAGSGFTAPLSALISASYLKESTLFDLVALKQAGKIEKLLLDTGTYSINTGGKGPSNQDDFMKYMHITRRHGHHFDLIIAYDHDFTDPLHNQILYEKMLKELAGTGLAEKIVPVVHDAKHGAEEFELYADMGAKYIGIGSSPPLPRKEWERINHIRFRQDVSIHIFGNLGLDLLKEKMPESADSARYAHDAKYGDISYWDPNTKTLKRLKVLGSKFNDKHREFLRGTFGMTPSDLLADVTNRWIVNLYALHQMQEYLTTDWYVNNDVADW